MLWWWPRHITLNSKLVKMSCSMKVQCQILSEHVFPEKALWSLFGSRTVYRSTKRDCRPCAWGNKPVFDPGCRNHLVLWGILHFFLILAKALQSQSFKFPQSEGTCDCLGCLERSTPKSQGCFWNLLLPFAMFWPLLCFPLPFVTIWRQDSSSPLGFLPVLIFLFLSCLAIAAILLFQLWPHLAKFNYFFILK